MYEVEESHYYGHMYFLHTLALLKRVHDACKKTNRFFIAPNWSLLYDCYQDYGFSPSAFLHQLLESNFDVRLVDDFETGLQTFVGKEDFDEQFRPFFEKMHVDCIHYSRIYVYTLPHSVQDGFFEAVSEHDGIFFNECDVLLVDEYAFVCAEDIEIEPIGVFNVIFKALEEDMK